MDFGLYASNSRRRDVTVALNDASTQLNSTQVY